jgi:hypothetical protein
VLPAADESRENDVCHQLRCKGLTSLSPHREDRSRRPDLETSFATGATKPIFPTARRTACGKLLQLDWRNAARRLMKLWPSQAISHWKKWNGTPARRGRSNLRTPRCRSSNDEHKVSHPPARWDLYTSHLLSGRPCPVGSGAISRAGLKIEAISLRWNRGERAAVPLGRRDRLGPELVVVRIPISPPEGDRLLMLPTS